MSDDPKGEAPEPEAPSTASAPAAGSEPAIIDPEPPATAAPEPAPALPAAPLTTKDRIRRFAFLAIPAIAILELGAHLVQTHSVVSDAEWLAARDAVRTLAKPEDLVVMAPYWTDPVGREMFKDEILSLAREARPDATRFPRAVEVSTRGKHVAELAGWKVESKKSVGPITLTVYDNPAYRPLKDDLVDHVAPGKMSVSLVGNGAPLDCAFSRAKAETGGLGFGPALPAERFACPQGGIVAATVMQTPDYRPHRCILTPPLGGQKTVRVQFENVIFGQMLHGHAGIDWDLTSHPEEPPVTLTWKVGERTIGRIAAGAADGWKPFELDTRDLEGQTGQITAEVTSPSAHNRLYCFEADTR